MRVARVAMWITLVLLCSSASAGTLELGTLPSGPDAVVELGPSAVPRITDLGESIGSYDQGLTFDLTVLTRRIAPGIPALWLRLAPDLSFDSGREERASFRPLAGGERFRVPAPVPSGAASTPSSRVLETGLVPGGL